MAVGAAYAAVQLPVVSSVEADLILIFRVTVVIVRWDNDIEVGGADGGLSDVAPPNEAA